jgi:hypothetical protein
LLVWEDVEKADFRSFCFVNKWILHIHARILGTVPHNIAWAAGAGHHGELLTELSKPISYPVVHTGGPTPTVYLFLASTVQPDHTNQERIQNESETLSNKTLRTDTFSSSPPTARMNAARADGFPLPYIAGPSLTGDSLNIASPNVTNIAEATKQYNYVFLWGQTLALKGNWQYNACCYKEGDAK